MHHPHLRRVITGTAGSLLLAGALTACGGGASDAPDDASSEEFCSTFIDNAAASENASVDEIHKFADDLIEVGTPSSITGEAREGFEIYVDFAKEISEDDAKKYENTEEFSEIFDGDDATKVGAFFGALTTECFGDLGELEQPSEDAS